MPLERFSIDPTICHGQTCVRGTGIPVHQIVRMLANGGAVEDLLTEYPCEVVPTLNANSANNDASGPVSPETQVPSCGGGAGPADGGCAVDGGGDCKNDLG
jgi:hypothetical protein